MAFNRVDVPPLINGLRRERLLAESPLAAAHYQVAEAYRRIGDYDAQIAVQVAIIENLALTDQRGIIGENSLRPKHSGIFAFYFNRLVGDAGADIKAAFQESNVFIARPKQGLD